MDRQQALDGRRARRAAMTGMRETLDGRVPYMAALTAIQHATAEGRPAVAEAQRQQLELATLTGPR